MCRRADIDARAIDFWLLPSARNANRKALLIVNSRHEANRSTPAWFGNDGFRFVREANAALFSTGRASSDSFDTTRGRLTDGRTRPA